VRILRLSVALFATHGCDVQRVGGGRLVGGLLQLPSVDELHVRHGRPRRFSSIFVLEAAPERRQNLRPIVVQVVLRHPGALR
jgi:hypothetical protein